MAKQQRPTTWMEIAIRNGGLRKGVKALVWAYTWAVVREAEGHDPTVEEVASWWRDSERTAYRNQAAFRSCFPTLDTPASIHASEEAQAAVRQGAELGARIDSTKGAKPPSPDIAVLSLGMLPASPEAIP